MSVQVFKLSNERRAASPRDQEHWQALLRGNNYSEGTNSMARFHERLGVDPDKMPCSDPFVDDLLRDPAKPASYDSAMNPHSRRPAASDRPPSSVAVVCEICRKLSPEERRGRPSWALIYYPSIGSASRFTEVFIRHWKEFHFDKFHPELTFSSEFHRVEYPR